MKILEVPAERNARQKYIDQKLKEGYNLIFRPYKRDKNGKLKYARQYGHKVWPMLVKA